MAAAAHRLAAVVRPRMSVPCRMMAPPPGKPTPVTIWAVIRGVELYAAALQGRLRESREPVGGDEREKRGAQPQEHVRPEPRRLIAHSRSILIAPHSAAEIRSRTTTSGYEMVNSAIDANICIRLLAFKPEEVLSTDPATSIYLSVCTD